MLWLHSRIPSSSQSGLLVLLLCQILGHHHTGALLLQVQPVLLVRLVPVQLVSVRLVLLVLVWLVPVLLVLVLLGLVLECHTR